jgi:hypothetical protein
MRDALVFNGASNLDFQDIRTNVIRIPEVIQRIREAQKIWDAHAKTSLDLANFIASEDSVFLGHIKLKAFATAIVQTGLLDRYLKTNKLPEYVLGAVNGDSPLLVAIGKKTFLEMVTESSALTGVAGRTVSTLSGGFELPVLAGVQLAEYGIFRKNDKGEYQRQLCDSREVDKMLLELVDQYDVQKLAMIGPGNSIFKKVLEFTSRDVQIIESIDSYPMLSWFWSNMRENRLAVAN